MFIRDKTNHKYKYKYKPIHYFDTTKPSLRQSLIIHTHIIYEYNFQCKNEIYSAHSLGHLGFDYKIKSCT